MPFKRFKYIIMQLRVSNDSRVKHGTPSKQKKKQEKQKAAAESARRGNWVGVVEFPGREPEPVEPPEKYLGTPAIPAGGSV